MIENKSKILVTGVAGFIGSHLVKRLVDNGLDVIGIDNINSYYDVNLKLDRLKWLGINSLEGSVHKFNGGRFSFYKRDLSDPNWFDGVELENINIVIHLAAQAGVRYSLEKPQEYITSNIVGFQNILSFCETNHIMKLIYASSSSVYGNESKEPFRESELCNKPESLYAATKRSNELMAYSYYKTKGIESVGLRFFTVYGPWGRPDMAPMLFAKALQEGEPIRIFNHGMQKRDFTYIDDIINGIELTIRNFVNGNLRGSEIFNLGCGNPVNLLDFVEHIESAFKKSFEKTLTDAQLGDVSSTYADMSKFKEITDFKPDYNLQVGLKRFAEWYKGYYLDKDEK